VRVPNSEQKDLMQALENVTRAGIFDVEHANQPGSNTRGNYKSE